MLVSVFRGRGLPKKGTIFQKPKEKNADPEESGPQITSDIEKRAGREEIGEDAQHRCDGLTGPSQKKSRCGADRISLHVTEKNFPVSILSPLQDSDCFFLASVNKPTLSNRRAP